MLKRIWVTFEKHGIHYYKDAPEEVAYLRNLHRHLFKVKVTIEVYHNDREIEFHLFQKFLIENGNLNFDYRSCEMIAEDLLEIVKSKYPNRTISVEVSEDGECGAILDYNPSEC